MTSPFDAVADHYDAARPDYPDRLFAALPPLRDRLVLEIGAGTGLATEGLVAHGADVLALDLGAVMLHRLRSRVPGAGCVQAVAEHLPVRTAGVDLVCCAQAWHWFDVAAASAEVARVLRPGGLLAIWWNSVDADGEHWWEWQQRRISELNPSWTHRYRERDYAGELAATGRFLGVRTETLRWSRRLDLDRYERWLRSKSYVDALGPATEPFIAEARVVMAEAFGGESIVEPFRTDLWVATAAPA